MSETDGKVSILLVDDRPEKLLALEAVLEDLGQTVVRAYSGREALRHVLNHDFAVILLDVNMPGMDGFETASLIRQRKSSQHVPIIFITAMGDELHAARGYALGAVDYILSPVVPEVLRSKVAVFVDLFKKTERVKRQGGPRRARAAAGAGPRRGDDRRPEPHRHQNDRVGVAGPRGLAGGAERGDPADPGRH